jgi:hypothetical protein
VYLNGNSSLRAGGSVSAAPASRLHGETASMDSDQYQRVAHTSDLPILVKLLKVQYLHVAERGYLLRRLKQLLEIPEPANHMFCLLMDNQ